jgi:crotonobetainyl-CoA:carnitine CoA-transferase CaiB-like acyl-CoA transferase
MFMNGEPGGSSLKMPVALIDILAAHHLKEAILLALIQKNKTGIGAFVEVSLLQAAVSSLANQASNWLVAGVIPKKQGSAHPNIAPYGDIFRTSDSQEVLLAVGSDRQFEALCKILQLQTTDEFRTNMARVQNRQTLNRLLANGIQRLEASALSRELDRANIPFGIVRNIQEVFDEPGIAPLLLRSIDRVGVRTYVGNTFRDNSSHILPPPHFGEHSREILIQSLAKSVDEVKSLQAKGIIA